MANVSIELPAAFDESIKRHLTAVANATIEQVRRDMTITKDYLSFNEVTGHVLDISRTTLDKWVSMGLPVYRIDAKRYFKRSDLYNFIEQYKEVRA